MIRYDDYARRFINRARKTAAFHAEDVERGGREGSIPEYRLKFCPNQKVAIAVASRVYYSKFQEANVGRRP